MRLVGGRGDHLATTFSVFKSNLATSLESDDRRPSPLRLAGSAKLLEGQGPSAAVVGEAW
jgi:hypothetical protein